MRNSSVFKTASFLVALGWAVSASTATAGGIPELEPPEVFSGDFGIELAKNYADGESVLGGIEGIVGPQFPWDGGFEFPATLPSPPANRPPAGGSSGADFAGSSASAGRVPVVPEPTTGVLMALGLTALGISRRRRAA